MSLVGIHVGHTVWRMSNRASLFWAERICPHTCWCVWQFIVQPSVSWALHVVQVRCPVTAAYVDGANAKQHEENTILQSSLVVVVWLKYFFTFKSTIRFKCENFFLFKSQFVAHFDLFVSLTLKITLRVSSSRYKCFLRTHCTDWCLLPISITV